MSEEEIFNEIAALARKAAFSLDRRVKITVEIPGMDPIDAWCEPVSSWTEESVALSRAASPQPALPET